MRPIHPAHIAASTCPPPFPPAGPTWDELAQFPDVHLIHGSPLSGRDLARASAASAARAIVFPHMGHPMDSCTALEQQSLRDADVVFAVQKLRKLQPEIEVLAELVNPAHMAFLSPGRAVQGLGSIALYMLPVYASGQVRAGRGWRWLSGCAVLLV